MNCGICGAPIAPGTAVVCLVGGMFPVDEPDFFMTDEQIMKEQYTHLDCMRDLSMKGVADHGRSRAKV